MDPVWRNEDSILTNDEDEDGSDSEASGGVAGAAQQVGEQAVVASLGATGLPKEFCGDIYMKAQAKEEDRTNNNVTAVLADRWAERFKAAFPGLQHVLKLGEEQREYLDSLVYDEQSETPSGDGRSYGHAIRHVDVPLTRLAVEGPPGKYGGLCSDLLYRTLQVQASPTSYGGSRLLQGSKGGPASKFACC